MSHIMAKVLEDDQLPPAFAGKVAGILVDVLAGAALQRVPSVFVTGTSPVGAATVEAILSAISTRGRRDEKVDYAATRPATQQNA